MEMPMPGAMNEDDVRAQLLEQLMQLMDGRISGEAMPEHAMKKPGGAEIEIAIGPSGDGEDPEMDEEMQRIVREKRGY